jgi:hypothetical protein
MFALSRLFGVRALPWMDQAGFNGIPLELSGQTDTISIRQAGDGDAGGRAPLWAYLSKTWRAGSRLTRWASSTCLLFETRAQGFERLLGGQTGVQARIAV